MTDWNYTTPPPESGNIVIVDDGTQTYWTTSPGAHPKALVCALDEFAATADYPCEGETDRDELHYVTLRGKFVVDGEVYRTGTRLVPCCAIGRAQIAASEGR